MEAWSFNNFFFVNDDYDDYDLEHGKSQGALCWRGKARMEP